MRKYNAENERVKRDYRVWLKEAHGRSDATLDAAAAAIDRFQAHTGYRPFKTFRREQAVSFKRFLADERHPTTGKPLSAATLYAMTKALRGFFEWLSREHGYRQAIHVGDAAYFNLSANEARIATATRERPAPSLEQVNLAIRAMPHSSTLERRDRAVVAFTLLTGARDAAVVSARIKHVDLEKARFFQDAREVKTKRAKTFTTVFFPVGDEARAIVAEWIAELHRDHAFGRDDPLFPSSRRGLDNYGNFATLGFTREPWASTGPVRDIFRRAFEPIGLPYFHPHSLRRTLMRLAYDLKPSLREAKAWSQNLGHDSMVTSLVSYGGLGLDEQAAAIEELGRKSCANDEDPAALVARLAAVLAKRPK